VRLNRRSKCVLEYLLLSGIEVLEFSAHPKGLIYRSAGWTSQRNADRHLETLSNKGLISAKRDRANGRWVASLTEKGKGILLDEIDPIRSWGESWDGIWTLLSFDLSKKAFRERKQLDSWLRKRRFGYLQGSMWISHRKYQSWSEELEMRKGDPRAIIFQELIPVGKIASKHYVSRAWPFDRTNQYYRDYIEFVEDGIKNNAEDPRVLIERESQLWQKAFQLDPFLPDSILPSGYLGKLAWKRKQQFFAKLARKACSDLG